ncbi:MAG: YicC/YloC family endoribonuclease [bacterium]|nr:YicC/YloC family endoribonuclease [bacterium]
MQSMTGFGVQKGKSGPSVFYVEAKSVNHRYLELNLRCPPAYLLLEKNIVEEARRYFSRGRIDLFIREESSQKQNLLDPEASRQAVAFLRRLKKELGLKGEVTLDHLLACRDLIGRRRDVPTEEIKKDFLKTVSLTFQELQKMRRREGSTLLVWFQKTIRDLEKGLEKIRKESIQANQLYRKRLEQKTKTLRGMENYREKIAAETALFTDKTDVTEEITRLKSHLSQFLGLIGAPEPAGRKLEFLCQEMLREINTIGSKVQSVFLTKQVVLFKSELDKIREQVQNVE